MKRPLFGKFSQTGILIHEIGHFEKVADLDDYIETKKHWWLKDTEYYGHNLCKKLVKIILIRQ